MTDYSDLSDDELTKQWYAVDSTIEAAKRAGLRMDRMENALTSERAVKQPTLDDTGEPVEERLKDVMYSLNQIQDELEEDRSELEERRGGEPRAD